MHPSIKRAVFLTLVGVAVGSLALCQGANNAEPSLVHVLKSAGGVTLPSPIPPNFNITAAENCQNPVSGVVTLAAVIDPSGRPRNIQFVHPIGNDLDRLAVKILAAEHFNPGMQNSSAVAVGVSIAITLQACNVTVLDTQGKQKYQLQLQAKPEQTANSFDGFPADVVYAPDEPAETSESQPKLYRVAGDVSAPVALTPPVPVVVGNGEGKAKYQGMVLISLVVDSQGFPQNLRVVRPLGLGLDQKALEAVANYRFMPALLHHNQPVPVMITTDVNFRIF